MGDYFKVENPGGADLYKALRDQRAADMHKQCKGCLNFCRNLYQQPFIQCEKRRKGHRAHLILRNLNEFDIPYLQALLNNDLSMICSYKEAAFLDSYGPLAPCHSVAAPREQKELCPTWHRDSHGILTRGIMVHTKKCPAVFEFYYPYDLNSCPYVLLVCRNPHSHVNPKPSKTPQAVLDVFNSLLEDLGWKLADATPQRIILDSAFVNGLRRALGWVELCDLTLGDLHPSLSTSLEGAYHILAEHAQLPLEKCYVRCVEEHKIPGEGKIYIIICMFRAMSELLLKTTRPSIDTSFKRLHKWQEFEIEVWFPEYLHSIVVARAFTTSQSAEAHRILFNRIFAIVHEDTGKTVQFRHIHGVGFNTFMADGHLGQALGLGLCCEEICQSMAGYCAIEWTKALYMLTPYEHLARIYRYCFAHFVRNVLTLKGYISLEVQATMMSLASAEPLPNFEATLQQIREGGKKAAGGFALAALYQPASKIPIKVWKASPSTSNGNEQAHRSINRDGVKLTMLAGIMRGMQYDSRAMTGLQLLSTYGAVQKHTVEAHDVELQTAYQQLVGLHHNVQTQSKTLKHAMETGKGVEKALKKLHKTDEQLQTVHAGLRELASQSSGTVAIPEPLNLPGDSSVFTASAPNEHLVVPQQMDSGPPHSPDYYNFNSHDHQISRNTPPTLLFDAVSESDSGGALPSFVWIVVDGIRALADMPSGNNRLSTAKAQPLSAELS
ncbi:hypothetical protein K439DRAFT_1612787 [Ramaria rubella]|nr:hypothetical protein K439DRAFT_1612787 [Ramaria rubella]